MFPETRAKIPRVNTMIADEPAASPSIPSVRLAPLDTAVTMRMIIGMNNNQAYSLAPSPAHSIK